MLYFGSDYQEGAIPEIIEALCETNLRQTTGYGEDEYCASAANLIRRTCGREDLRIHFFVGGTQTNSVCIHAMLRPYEGVLAAETGHICGHEAGAVESKGHKVLPIPQKDGKITGDAIRCAIKAHFADDSWDHAVQPGMVYISHPTERGTLYTKAELEDIRRACDESDLPLFVDGARMGYGLAAEGTDVTLADFARLADVFYIGGTKCGALFGEAVVVCNPKLMPHFFTLMKQSGAVLAKGRLLGIQFHTLFADGLNPYVSACAQGCAMAQRLKAGFLAKAEKGYEILWESKTNLLFVRVPASEYARLAKDVVFSAGTPEADGSRVCRFACSWATTEEQVDALVALL